MASRIAFTAWSLLASQADPGGAGMAGIQQHGHAAFCLGTVWPPVRSTRARSLDVAGRGGGQAEIEPAVVALQAVARKEYHGIVAGPGVGHDLAARIEDRLLLLAASSVSTDASNRAQLDALAGEPFDGGAQVAASLAAICSRGSRGSL